MLYSRITNQQGVDIVKKTCVSCKSEKESSEFNKSKNSVDGYKTYCRKCASEQNKRYREKHREKINKKKIADYELSKTHSEEKTLRELSKKYRICNTCGDKKAILEFYKRGNGGFYSICRSCHIKTTSLYAINNIEETRKNRVQREQRRRSRKKNLTDDFSEEEWLASMEYFKVKNLTQCAYCGDTESKLTQDHFIPLSKGGHYTKNNIIPVCFTCNTQKHNINFYQWYATKDFYCERRIDKIEEYLNKINQDNPEPSEVEIP